MRPLGLMVFGLLLTLAGCGPSPSPTGRNLLLQSYQASRDSDFPRVVGLTNRYLDEFRRSNRADEALYLRGHAYCRMIEPERARADLLEALDRSSHTELKANAALALGELAMESGQLDEAQQWYTRSLALEDRKGPAERAYLQLGVILQRQGRWNDADIQFSRLAYLFEGPSARQARERMFSRAWTVQAGCFADRGRADNLAAQLLKGGLTPTVKPALTDSGMATAVQVGRYATYDEALAQLATVRAAAGRAVQVVVTR